jgi:hypothetical protein
VELHLHSPNAPSWRGAQGEHRDKFFKPLIKDEMDGICSTHGRDNICIRYFGWKTWSQETSRKMEA